MKFTLYSVMSPSEAGERWGIKRNTVIAALNRKRFDKQIENGLVRKHVLENSKTEWYITEQAMRETFGEPKIKSK